MKNLKKKPKRLRFGGYGSKLPAPMLRDLVPDGLPFPAFVIQQFDDEITIKAARCTECGDWLLQSENLDVIFCDSCGTSFNSKTLLKW